MAKNKTHVLYDLCKDHHEFNMDKFKNEGAKMKEFGLLDYFCTIIKEFKSRGSSPGMVNKCNSSMAYWMGLTTQKPLGEFKPTEKLIATRVSPPDVDIDFDYFRRQEIYDYLVRTYGSDYTCNIGTYNIFKARAALRYISKTMAIGGDWDQNAKDIGEKTKRLSDEIAKMSDGETLEESMKENPDLARVLEKYPEFKAACLAIEGKNNYTGIHAAGIIVSNTKICEVAPLSNQKGTLHSQFDKDEMEDIGLLKFDILALKTLSVISNTIKLVKQNHNVDIAIDELVPDDNEVFKVLSNGFTKGIFQMEGGGITELLRKVKVSDFEDMIATNAIYRPGPLGADVDKLYCELKHGHQKVVYEHPSMESALKSTYGLIIYQEQVMKISKDMAGFTSSEADKLRKAIGKKKFDIMASLKDKFVKGCVLNGIPEKVATDTWDKIEVFGGYGFNRAHAACYAYIAYQTAYLKRYHTTEFMCSLLSAEIGDQDKTSLYVNECHNNMKIRVLPPDVSSSGEVYRIIPISTGRGAIRSPLSSIKGIGEKASLSIINNQPYNDFNEFVRKNNIASVNVKVISTLAENNCFSCFGQNKDWNGIFADIKNELKNEKVPADSFSDNGLSDMINKGIEEADFLDTF